jgi:hypothetical protein
MNKKDESKDNSPRGILKGITLERNDRSNFQFRFEEDGRPTAYKNATMTDVLLWEILQSLKRQE